MTADSPVYDPYLGCEDGCSHDLAKGILTSDLLRDGPFKITSKFPNSGMQAANAMLELIGQREENASDTTEA
jgi:hypothetical protein